MKRKIPSKRRSPTPWFQCPTRGCDCKMMKCEDVETSVHDTMRQWLDEYTIQIKAESRPSNDPVEAALEAVQGQLSALQFQQDSLCEYLEKGVYSIGMFTKRNSTLEKEIKRLQITEADLMRQKAEGSQRKSTTAQIIPTTQHILENYSVLSTEEKNRLWKLVLKKVTIYRSQAGEMTVNIYPNLPK